MIDGDDHDEARRDPEARTEEGAPPAEESRTDAGDTTVDDRPEEAARQDHSDPAVDAQAPAEEQPAMELEAGSDEGGTVANTPDEQSENRNDMPESPEESAVGDESEGTAEAETLAEDGEFDGAALDEEEDEHAFEGEDLGLVSDDDALPWLESSDYEEIESVDAWRITGFVVLGLVVLALLVGGIWYFTSRSNDGTPLADGSTIEAPEGPYKERPEDPGGKTFEGTGDMAPAVGDGETREGRLAKSSATPEPVARASEEPAAKPAPEPSASSGQDSRIAVQVGAYRDEATAEAGWRQLSRQTDALSGVKYRIVKGEADIGTVYRLQALPGDMAAARRLSDALKADGVASQIKQ
ncbi:SPOR domain-containing protein [Citromicrobium bathyomarinum]|uniref:SPOR domain-containing protein n=1 Tax=Citromicrobium bathyomarinum TaxID=72174 RepID=UPI00315A75B0